MYFYVTLNYQTRTYLIVTSPNRYPNPASCDANQVLHDSGVNAPNFNPTDCWEIHPAWRGTRSKTSLDLAVTGTVNYLQGFTKYSSFPEETPEEEHDE